MSRTGVPSTMSTPAMLIVSPVTLSSLTNVRPMLAGLWGDLELIIWNYSSDNVCMNELNMNKGNLCYLVLNTPTLSPPRRGGATFALIDPVPVFWWNTQSSQMCENSDRFCREWSGLVNTFLFIVKLALANGDNPLWRGVPFCKMRYYWCRVKSQNIEIKCI